MIVHSGARGSARCGSDQIESLKELSGFQCKLFPLQLLSELIQSANCGTQSKTKQIRCEQTNVIQDWYSFNCVGPPLADLDGHGVDMFPLDTQATTSFMLLVHLMNNKPVRST